MTVRLIADDQRTNYLPLCHTRHERNESSTVRNVTILHTIIWYELVHISILINWSKYLLTYVHSCSELSHMYLYYLFFQPICSRILGKVVDSFPVLNVIFCKKKRKTVAIKTVSFCAVLDYFYSELLKSAALFFYEIVVGTIKHCNRTDTILIRFFLLQIVHKLVSISAKIDKTLNSGWIMSCALL